MAQGVLPYKYEEEKNDVGMTAMAGLPIYLDLSAWGILSGLMFMYGNRIRGGQTSRPCSR